MGAIYQIEEFCGCSEYNVVYMSDDLDEIKEEFNKRIAGGQKDLRLIQILEDGPFGDDYNGN